MSRKIVLLVVVALAMTSCGGQEPCESDQSAEIPMVSSHLGPLPLLPTGQYPVKGVQISYEGIYSDGPNGVAIVLADPTESSTFRYYSVAASFVTVMFDAPCHAGYANARYESVTIHLPEPGCIP